SSPHETKAPDRARRSDGPGRRRTGGAGPDPVRYLQRQDRRRDRGGDRAQGGDRRPHPPVAAAEPRIRRARGRARQRPRPARQPRDHRQIVDRGRADGAAARRSRNPFAGGERAADHPCRRPQRPRQLGVRRRPGHRRCGRRRSPAAERAQPGAGENRRRQAQLYRRAHRRACRSGCDRRQGDGVAGRPLEVAGGLTWQGTRLSFKLALADPAAFLAGKPSGLDAEAGAPDLVQAAYHGTIAHDSAKLTADGALSLDGVAAKGRITVENKGPRPTVAARLTLDRLDLTRYLGGAGHGRPPSLTPLHLVDANLDLSLGPLTLDTIKIA